MTDFDNLKSGGIAVQNTFNNNEDMEIVIKFGSSSGDYSWSVVLEFSAKPSLGCRTAQPWNWTMAFGIEGRNTYQYHTAIYADSNEIR